MRAVVYHGPGQKSWEEVPKPVVVDNTDAIVRVDATTICRPCSMEASPIRAASMGRSARTELT